MVHLGGSSKGGGDFYGTFQFLPTITGKHCGRIDFDPRCNPVTFFRCLAHHMQLVVAAWSPHAICSHQNLLHSCTVCPKIHIHFSVDAEN
jgi:hypothetical protein